MKYFLAFLLSFPCVAFAQDITPARHPSQQIEMDKSAVEAKKAELESQAKKISGEMDDTKDALVSVAADVKKNEARLTELDKRIVAGRKEQDEIEARLKKDRRSIGDLVLALERLDRTPPEAILAKPGAPLETAQSAMLLQSILPNIYDRAEHLKKDLARLDELIASLQKDREDVKETSQSLAEKQKTMNGLLKKRQALYASTRGGIKEQEAELREISARAENIQQLVSRVEDYQKQAESRTQNAIRKKQAGQAEEEDRQPAPAMARATPIPKAGAAQLPISGVIRVGYKQRDDIGAESQGLTIEGRPGALVVSPMGGVVRYAGSFRNYGQIIIVEHQKEYHSLIAGLARIDTVVGQSVAAGEPVGTLPRKSDGGGNPTLYYELRLNGEPVNPARKFAGL